MAKQVGRKAVKKRKPRLKAKGASSLIPKMLTRQEARVILRVALSTLDEAIRTGVIPHVRVCRRVFIPENKLRAFLEETEA
jgi:excisionase family DNA binding protein